MSDNAPAADASALPPVEESDDHHHHAMVHHLELGAKYPVPADAPSPDAPTPPTAGPPPAEDSAAALPADGGVITSVDGQLAKRPVSYNKPTELTFGQPTPVQVEINVTGEAIVDDFKNLPGQVDTHQISVSREMTAELTGPADRVKIQLRPGVQPWQRLTSAGNPTWIWDATALAPGKANLDLTIKAKVVDQGGTTETVIHTYHDVIPVRMGLVDGVKWWIGQIDPVWKWIAGVIAALGSAYVWWRTNVAKKTSA